MSHRLLMHDMHDRRAPAPIPRHASNSRRDRARPLPGSRGLRPVLWLLAVLAFPTDVLAEAALRSSFISHFADGPAQALALADLDRDGLPDFVTANGTEGTIAIGLSGANYRQPQVLPAGTPVGAVILARFDADEYWDLASIGAGAHVVRVQLGIGLGRFGPIRSFPVGLEPRAIVAADFDQDGKTDLAVACDSSNTISILIGTGNGSFTRGTDIPSRSSPVALAAADLDADGKADLVVLDQTASSFSIHRGLGDARFQLVGETPTGPGPRALAVGFLDEDAILDVATANWAGNSVTLWLGRGDGTLRLRRDVATAPGPIAVEIGDIDADGRADVVYARSPYISNDADGISVMRGRGGGSVGPGIDFVSGAAPHALKLADLDGDGRTDVAVACARAREVAFHFGNGRGGFGDGIALVANDSPYRLISGDLNRDGRSDLVYSHAIGITVMLGRGDATFDTTTYLPPMPAVRAGELLIDDYDRDGRPDLLVTEPSGFMGGAMLYRGVGGGRLAAAVATAHFTAGESAALGDLDGDGLSDLVLDGGNTGYMYGAKGNGRGGFTKMEQFAPIYAEFTDLKLADLDHDGKLDLVSLRNRGAIAVMKGQGNGAFSAAVEYPTVQIMQSFQLADLDEDGNLDMIWANNSIYVRSISVRMGQHGGTFGPIRSYEAGTGSWNVAVADLDQDGRLDVVTTNSSSNTITVLHGDGRGAFGPPRQFGAAYGSSPIAVGDWNGDSRPDLAVGGRRTIVLLLSEGDLVPVAAAARVLRAEPGSVRVQWTLGERPLEPLVLERSVDVGPWIGAGAPIWTSDRTLEFEDHSARAGVRHGYRLRSGSADVFGEVWVDVAGGLELFIPAPLTRGSSIRFVVAVGSPVRLELHDVTGRRVARRDLAVSEAGAHALPASVWGGVPSGIYFAVLIQGDRRVARRACLVR